MLNVNINYPYPVIREYTEDYQTTDFIGDLGDIDLIPAGKYRDHMMKTRVGQY